MNGENIELVSVEILELINLLRKRINKIKGIRVKIERSF